MELSGKIVAQKIQAELKKEIQNLKEQGTIPSLAVILVGENPASLTYVRAKEAVAEKLGVDFRLFHFAINARENQVLDLVNELNNNNRFNGIVIQLPVPAEIDAEEIIQAVDPKKDIDGLQGQITPPAAGAIIELMKYYHLSWEGDIVLVGHGRLVGEPLEKILVKQGLNPRIFNAQSPEIKHETLKAKILVAATGMPGLIKPEMVSSEAIVLDAGTAESGGKVKGDVEPAVYFKVKAYSPVPGGIGPVTVAMLMKNLVEAAKKPILK